MHPVPLLLTPCCVLVCLSVEKKKKSANQGIIHLVPLLLTPWELLQPDRAVLLVAGGKVQQHIEATGLGGVLLNFDRIIIQKGKPDGCQKH